MYSFPGKTPEKEFFSSPEICQMHDELFKAINEKHPEELRSDAFHYNGLRPCEFSMPAIHKHSALFLGPITKNPMPDKALQNQRH